MAAQKTWEAFEEAYENYKKYGIFELEKQLNATLQQKHSMEARDVAQALAQVIKTPEAQQAIRSTLRATSPSLAQQLLQVEPQLRQHHQPRVAPEQDLTKTLKDEVSPGQRFKQPKWAKFDFAPATQEAIRNIARQLTQDPKAGQAMTTQYDQVLKDVLRQELQKRLKAKYMPKPGQSKKIEPKPY